MSILLTILQLLPSILQAVKAVEDVVGSGQGQTKKAIVMSAITTASQSGEKVPDKTVQAISTTIDHVVTLLNDSGILNPKSSSAVPSA